MRRKLPLLLSAVFVAFSVAACEGPVGPRGPAGQDGADGADGAAGPAGPQGPAGENALNTCSDCHSSDATIVAIEQQFDLGPHALGNFYMRASGSCVDCHTHQGFVARFSGEEPDFTLGAASMNCRTCHQIHTTYEAADFAVTTTDPVKLLVADAAAPYADSVVDFGFDGAAPASSNVCASCHQARSEDAWPDWQADLTTMFTLGNHYDFHHGPQSNTFVAELPESVEFGETTTGAFGSHEQVSCVGCHMGLEIEGYTPTPTPTGEASHTFRPDDAICGTCHDATFDYNGVQTDVAADLARLEACLTAEGLLDAEGHAVVGDYPEPYVAAFLVWQVATEDGSLGVHQPRYIPDIVANAAQYMEDNSLLCPVVAP